MKIINFESTFDNSSDKVIIITPLFGINFTKKEIVFSWLFWLVEIGY